VREGQAAARVLNHQWLTILERGRTRGRVAVVADRRRAFEPAEYFSIENIGDQTHAAMRNQRLAIGRDDARGFLTAMLQCVESEVNEIGRLRMAVHAEDAALLMEAVDFRFGGIQLD
jgi:hypothetical protein